MRAVTGTQARDEVVVLDLISSSLNDAIRGGYKSLREGHPSRAPGGDDIELRATLHNIGLAQTQALEEVGRRGYGRVVYVREEDTSGRVVKTSVYRVSQANAGLPEASIIARNSLLGSEIVSSRVGEEIEITLPGGEKIFLVTHVIDIEGAVELLRPRPDIRLARFHDAQSPKNIDVVNGVRAFVEDLDRAPPPVQPPSVTPKDKEEPSRPRVDPNAFWPADWSKVRLSDEDLSALGSQFFTRTTKEQEAAIRAVRGLTVVNGTAGTGKTSVALGRLKFFANFRSGEHLQEYGLDPNDWTDFDSSNMIGFVLSPSLVQYLRQTIEQLEMRMKVVDFEEFRNQEREQRRVFGRPYKRSPERNAEIQWTSSWLATLAAISGAQIAAGIGAILSEPLTKPDTPDGKDVTDERWKSLEQGFWEKGPLRGRLVGLKRSLEQGGSALRGIASALDRDIRLSDREIETLGTKERRALRDAVLNLSLRLFRLLNPTDLYANAFSGPALRTQLEKDFAETLQPAISAAEVTARRLRDRLVTDDDVVTALCLNALACDRFERDIKDIPYLRTFSDRIGVFIDEYQDFTEQQIFLMGYRAKPKYRQITVSGDVGQRLHAGGINEISKALPFIPESPRSITLDVNFRQTEPLAQFSRALRWFTGGASKGPIEQGSHSAPVYVFDDKNSLADFAASKLAGLPGAASRVVISPTRETTETWFDLMASSLESSFRNPIISDRARLTERMRTHFTTPLEAKGLEFDVAIVPDISEFQENDIVSLNALYVAASRSRHAILLGCHRSQTDHYVLKTLREVRQIVLKEIPS